jgi:hypothetical protein
MTELLEQETLRSRIIHGFVYALIILAGITVFFIPLAFFDNLQDFTVGVIGLFLVLGGSVSAAGHLLKAIRVERTGYALVLPALTVLSGVLFVEADENAARAFVGLLMMALTLGLYGRQRDLRTLHRAQSAATVVYPDHGNPV